MNNNHTNGATKKVFIACPIFWDVDPYFFQSCMKLVQEISALGFHGVFRPQFGDSAVGRARNSLTKQFLDSDCTHLLFIDSDLVFSVDHIKRIMQHPEPIVGGLYCKKQQGTPNLVLNGLDDPKPVREDHMQQVKYIGTGFIRIAREVFEKMIEVYGDDLRYVCDHEKTRTEYDFWQMGVYKFKNANPRWLSEDWYFCQRAIDLGFEIWADMHIILKHSGNALYPLRDQEKILFNKDKTLDNFEIPTNCGDTLTDVFGGQYEFGIKFDEAPTIIDIGANAGAFAWWANWKWPGSRVTCYEPNGEIFGILQRNCAFVGASAINAAVGDRSRTTLFVGNDSPLTSGQIRTNRNGIREIPITVIDPSELPEADLVKVDVEGAEPYIVGHMNKLPQYLLVEYHTVENKELLMQMLAGKMIVAGDKQEEPGYGVLAFKKINHD